MVKKKKKPMQEYGYSIINSRWVLYWLLDLKKVGTSEVVKFKSGVLGMYIH